MTRRFGLAKMMRIQDDADNGIQAPQQQQAQQQQGGQTSESDHYPGLNISAENLDVLKRNGTRRCFFFQTCFGFTSGSQNNFLHFLLRVLMVAMEKCPFEAPEIISGLMTSLGCNLSSNSIIAPNSFLALIILQLIYKIFYT